MEMVKREMKNNKNVLCKHCGSVIERDMRTSLNAYLDRKYCNNTCSHADPIKKESDRKKLMGHSAWNKGKKFTAMVGNKHAFLGDRATKSAGNWRARQLYQRVGIPCEDCGLVKEKFQMVIHHENENPLDNDPTNIRILCRSCHIKVHREKLLLMQYGRVA